MTFKGLTGIDYNEEKARIDASGFDVCNSLKVTCSICGKPIDHDSMRIETIDVCTECQKDSEV